MDITVRTTTPLISEDRSWLADVDGTQATRSITLVVADFVEANHYPDGVIMSGTVIGRYTSGPHAGLWGRYDDTATDGRETAVGVLFSSVQVVEDNRTKARVGAPLQERGFILPVNLPPAHGLDAAARVDLGTHWIFRD